MFSYFQRRDHQEEMLHRLCPSVALMHLINMFRCKALYGARTVSTCHTAGLEMTYSLLCFGNYGYTHKAKYQQKHLENFRTETGIPAEYLHHSLLWLTWSTEWWHAHSELAPLYDANPVIHFQMVNVKGNPNLLGTRTPIGGWDSFPACYSQAAAVPRLCPAKSKAEPACSQTGTNQHKHKKNTLMSTTQRQTALTQTWIIHMVWSCLCLLNQAQCLLSDFAPMPTPTQRNLCRCCGRDLWCLQ